jgi:DNA-binding NtrC family response regulator
MVFNASCSEKRILIIDDMPEIRFSLRRQMGSLGCDTHRAQQHRQGCAGEARKRVLSISSCVITTSPAVPTGNNSSNSCVAATSSASGVLFVMVTGEKSYDSVVTAAECLPDDYLLKPFTADTLKMRLERLLDKKQRLRPSRSPARHRKNWNGVISACDEIIMPPRIVTWSTPCASRATPCCRRATPKPPRLSTSRC